MTKLRQFLKESESLEYLLTTSSFRESIDFLTKSNISENMKNGQFFLRGMKKNDDVFRGKVRKDREPLDSTKQIHKVAGSALKDKLGINIREQSLFVTANYMQARQYGSAFFILPIGKFETYASLDIPDLYHTLTDLGYIRYVLDNYILDDDKSMEKFQNLPPVQKIKRHLFVSNYEILVKIIFSYLGGTYTNERHDLSKFLDQSDLKILQNFYDQIIRIIIEKANYQTNVSKFLEKKAPHEISIVCDEYWAIAASNENSKLLTDFFNGR